MSRKPLNVESTAVRRQRQYAERVIGSSIEIVTKILYEHYVKPAEGEEKDIADEVFFGAAYLLMGGNDPGEMSLAQLRRLVAITQYVRDTCLDEIEAREDRASRAPKQL